MVDALDTFTPLTDDERNAAAACDTGGERDEEGAGELVSPVPADAPIAPATHPGLGAPTAIWTYRDGRGAPLSSVMRFDPPGQRKQFLPLSLWRDAAGLRWRWKAVPSPRPLYNLDRLAARPDAPVVICEGEKAADAAARVFLKSVAVTSSNGAEAAARADWKSLAGRKVMIWPDADVPGARFAREVATILVGLGCAVTVVDAVALAALDPYGGVREYAKGWDAADAADEWEDVGALRRAAVGLAKPFEPGPAYVSFRPYEMTSSGLTTETQEGRGKDKTIATVWIAAPFEILGASRDPQGRGWGKWLRWRDADGRVHALHVTDAALQGDLAPLCSTLAADGLAINRSHQRHLVNYLSAARVDGRVTIASQTGWCEVGGKLNFVLPAETIGPRGAETVILDGRATGPYEVRGTLKDWQEGVAAMVGGHGLAVLAVSAALAGPLLHISGQEGGGINFFGQSSKGKTTLLQLAASVWGRGASPGYVRPWRATSNGLEGLAAGANDTALILDELGELGAREAGPAFYSLSNGTGKARMRADTASREQKGWRVLVISSGEIPIAVKLGEDRGSKARAGQLVRMLDIPADRGSGHGAFDNAGAEDDAGKLAKAFKGAAISAYGTAGPEFVRRLIAEGIEGEDVRQLVSEFIAANVKRGSDGQIERAAQRIGLIAVAGELAVALDIVPWREGEARAAAAWALARWVEGRGGTEAAEVQQAIEQVRSLIEQHGSSRFDDPDSTEVRPVSNRLGWRRGAGAAREWWIPSETWRTEICGGLNPKFVAATLGERGMLEKASDGFQPVRKIDGTNKRVYIINASIFDGAADAP